MFFCITHSCKIKIIEHDNIRKLVNARHVINNKKKSLYTFISVFLSEMLIIM